MAYISTVDAAISIISTNRGTYAAAINRLDHAIANMQNISTNLRCQKVELKMLILPQKQPILQGPSFAAGKHGDVSASKRIETEYPNVISIEI